MADVKFFKAISLCAVVSFFVIPSAYATLASDVWTIAKPASKFCLAQKVPSMTGGLFRIPDLEKSLSIFDCYQENSAQRKAYSQLASIIFSTDYGGQAQVASSLRGKNVGLVQYFARKLKSDDVFFAQAKGFYDELQAFDRDFAIRQHLFGKKSSLKDVAGVDEYINLQPGWLWALALKHSQRNPRIAIELIGICGHDDVHFEPNLNRSGDQTFTCPMPGYTMFYVPRSLGADVDIPNDLKVKIAGIQAPMKGMSALPGKSYHVYSAAMFSCLMVSQGLSEAEVEATNSLIARAYRVVDMRNRVIFGKMYADDSTKTERALREDCKARRGVCPDFYVGNAYSQEREDRFVAAKLTEFDTYFLIDRWNMFKKAPIIGLPIDTDFTIGEKELRDVPEGWSTERFARAVARLRTYAIDIEWTQQQHLAGSKFAQKVCR